MPFAHKPDSAEKRVAAIFAASPDSVFSTSDLVAALSVIPRATIRRCLSVLHSTHRIEKLGRARYRYSPDTAATNNHTAPPDVTDEKRQVPALNIDDFIALARRYIEAENQLKEVKTEVQRLETELMRYVKKPDRKRLRLPKRVRTKKVSQMVLDALRQAPTASYIVLAEQVYGLHSHRKEKSLRTTLDRLRHAGLVTKSEEGVWAITPNV